MKNTAMGTFLAFVHLICVIGLTSGQSQRDKEKQAKDQILGRAYDGTVLPRGDNGIGPVHVNVTLDIKKILALDDNNMNMEVILKTTLEWIDSRLAYTAFPPNSGPENLTLPPSLIEKVWIPDVYVVNAVNTDTQKSNQYLKIGLSYGTVKYSFLQKLTTSCPMVFENYPHDLQTCEIKLKSYGFSDNDIQLHWNQPDSVRFTEISFVTGFKLENYVTDSCDTQTNTGLYSCLKVGLSLKRQCNYYLLHIYIPCTMLVIISWLSYWLHPVKSATGRLILCIFALGLAVIEISDFNRSLPVVSYTNRAIDIFTGTCLTFILTSLIEFVVINYLNQFGGHLSSDKKHISDSSEIAEQHTPLNPSGEEKSRSPEARRSGNKLASFIDVIFRIGIPVLFFVFIVLYWIVFV